MRLQPKVSDFAYTVCSCTVFVHALHGLRSSLVHDDLVIADAKIRYFECPSKGCRSTCSDYKYIFWIEVVVPPEELLTDVREVGTNVPSQEQSVSKLLKLMCAGKWRLM